MIFLIPEETKSPIKLYLVSSHPMVVPFLLTDVIECDQRASFGCMGKSGNKLVIMNRINCFKENCSHLFGDIMPVDIALTGVHLFLVQKTTAVWNQKSLTHVLTYCRDRARVRDCEVDGKMRATADIHSYKRLEKRRRPSDRGRV